MLERHSRTRLVLNKTNITTANGTKHLFASVNELKLKSYLCSVKK